MISDNYVVGDNAYLKELHNFFFEVLGMMSITHYGAIGDGRMDNYGPLQVAIDDAKRRGLNYLYVPYGRFIYTGQLNNLASVTFIGNPHAHIVNIRTGEEIEIKQFGVETVTTTNYEDLTNKPQINNVELAGDVSLSDLGVQGELTAGTNITIEDNVISATGGGGGGVSSAIVVYLNASTVTLSNADYDIELTQRTKIGTGLSLDTVNNCVTVGDGISYVRVSAVVDYSSNTDDQFKTAYIAKSGTKYCCIRQGKYTDADYTLVLPSVVMPVTSGDKITLHVNLSIGDKIYGKGGSDNYMETYMSVEAIG